jgi:hypothetical protein
MSSVELNEFINLVNAIDLAGLDVLVSLFMYQGFNPEMVLKHLMEIKKSKSISDEEFRIDMLTLICLGVMSGNYTEKNKKKIDPAGKDKADNLFVKYKMKVGSVKDDRKAVTLPRLLATFPIMTSKVNMSDLCPEKNYPGPFNSSELPKALKTPVFPSLIPSKFNENVKTFLMTASCCYSADQSFAINEKTAGKGADVIFKEQWQYVDISYKSSQPSQTERENYMKGLKIDYDAIVKTLRKYQELVDKEFSILSKDDLRKGLN